MEPLKSRLRDHYHLEVHRRASVALHFSFRRLLKLSNHWKLAKTRKPGHLEMYVYFSGNLSQPSERPQIKP